MCVSGYMEFEDWESKLENIFFNFVNPCPAEPGYTLPLKTV